MLLQMAADLPAYGFQVSILTFHIDPAGDVAANAPCPLYLLPLTRTYDLHAFRAALALRRFLRREHVRLVQTFFESSDLWAGLVSKLSGTGLKLIWSRRDMGILRQPKHARLYRLLRRMPDAVFAVAETVKRHVLEVDGVPAGRVQVIYNGLELGPDPPAKPPFAAGVAHIVTVGNLRPVKGQDVLLEAAAGLLHDFPGSQLTFVGAVLDEAYALRLRARVAELGLAQRVHFVGNVTEVRTFLQGTDLFVLPSRSEGFSNAILEAMAEGLPVIATTVGGNAEAVVDGQTGLLVPPDDVDALSAALKRLVTDPATAAGMGKAGRDRAAEEFSRDAIYRRIIRSYGDLLAKRAGNNQANAKDRQR